MADDLLFEDFKKTQSWKTPLMVTKVSNSSGLTLFAYQCTGLNWDQDGDPKCYGLNDQGQEIGHDRLKHAADPADNCQFHLDHRDKPSTDHVFRWVGLLSRQEDDPNFPIDPRPFLEARATSDSNGNRVLVGPNEKGFFPVKAPAAGYYVSTTSANTTLGTSSRDPASYADATKIPYQALATWWPGVNVNIGDFGLILCPERGTFTGFVFADGGSWKVGEVSTKVYAKLAPGQNPYNVNETLKCLVIVFPGSGAAVRPAEKYTSEDVVQRQVKDKVSKLKTVPDIASFVQFLALDADRGRFQDFRFGLLSEGIRQPAEARLGVIKRILASLDLSTPELASLGLSI